MTSVPANKPEFSRKSHNPHGNIGIPKNTNWVFHAIARLFAALFLTLFLIAAVAEVRAQTAPSHASSKPVVRHPAVAAANNCSFAISGLATSAMYSRESNFFPVEAPDI